jgi:hypothetical protein
MTTFTPQQIREQYHKLPPEVQDFIMSNETTDMIAAILEESNLTPEQSEEADTEILYAMYGLQSQETTVNNIVKISGKTLEDLGSLKPRLEDKIFKPIREMGGVMVAPTIMTPPQPQTTTPVPEKSNTFIITQETKKAVIQELAQRVENAKQQGAPSVPKIINSGLPMVEKGEVAHNVPPLPKTEAREINKVEIKVTSSTPIDTTGAQNKSQPVAKYTPGKDPYREPIE